MSPSAQLILKLLRSPKSEWELAYAAGMVTGIYCYLEPWEACYLDHVKSAILRGGRA